MPVKCLINLFSSIAVSLGQLKSELLTVLESFHLASYFSNFRSAVTTWAG